MVTALVLELEDSWMVDTLISRPLYLSGYSDRPNQRVKRKSSVRIICSFMITNFCYQFNVTIMNKLDHTGNFKISPI